MKFLLSTTILFLGLMSTGNAGETADWRNSAPLGKKVENLVEVMPGASNLMLQMGDRYRNLYHAGKQGKWEFADYQVEEMQDLVETLMVTRPKRAASAQVFLEKGFKSVLAAIKRENWNSFSVAFQDMRKACMTCHVDNDHAFIVLPGLPRSAPSPVLENE